MKTINDYLKFDYSLNNEYLLIDTYDRDDDINCYLEDFKEFCEDNDYVIVGKNTEMEGLYLGGKITFWDWYYKETSMEDEEFWYSFRKAIKNEPLCTRSVITGSCGLWDGNRTIVPTLVDNLYDAVIKCLKDCEYYKLTIKDNVLYVQGSHHDGTNCFEIRLVNSENYDKINYWDDKEDGDIEKFFEDKNNFNEFYWDFFGLA